MIATCKNFLPHVKMPTPSSIFPRRLSSDEELAVMKKRADHLKNNPDELKELLVKMGIHTKSGKLSKAYGG